MPWDHGREVRVTSRAELDAALRSADRIVIEDDPGLTAYARHIAGGDPALAIATARRLRPIADLERDAHVATLSRAPRLWPWVAGAAGLAVAAGAALLLEHFARPESAAARRAALVPAARIDPATLAWPAVTVALIVALYLIARQAIASGRDVQIAWQITEKVGGRVVITRVRGRAA